HAIKGGAANLGARRLASVCGELERMGLAGKLTGAAPLIDEARVEFEKVCIVLAREQQGSAS
ncbi:MAG: Hpt domain-containing protein, partial [Myxococcales bacterium]